MHLAVDFELRDALTQNLAHPPHLQRRRMLRLAEIRVGEQRHPGFYRKTTNLSRRCQGDLNQVINTGVVVDEGVSNEQGAVTQCQDIERGEQAGVGMQPDAALDLQQVFTVLTKSAADQRVSTAVDQSHSGDQCRVLAQLLPRNVLRDALAQGLA